MATITSQQSRIRPLWWLPYVAYKWLVIIPTLLLSTLILGSLIIVLSFFGLGDMASRIFGTLWARLNATVTLMKVKVQGREKLKPGQSYVLAANHMSLVDIYVLYGYTGLDLKWVMKQELRSVPVLGLACEMMGHIYVDRSNSEAALASISNAEKRLRNGMCVIFFPEGTRSRTSELRKFKKGAFRMANDLSIPIVPVSIHNTNRIVPSDTLDWRPGTVKLTFHDPIQTAGMTARQISALSVETRDIIVGSLNAETLNTGCP
jgi:1-acyl-sn-glycerol-3-phosphate acyltransferase